MRNTLFFILISLFATLLSAQEEGMALMSDSITPPDTTVFQSISMPVKVPRPSTNPVDVDDEKPRTVLHYYDKHGDPLDEPVMFLAVLDTVQKVRSKPLYPLYNGINIGINFGDLIFAAFGRKYGSYDLWANVSLHNWFFPTVECGLGYAASTPARGNFTYRTRPSLYAKIGLNYNFLYKSNPDYQVFLGLRAGASRFTYDLTDVSINSDYWNESQILSLKGLRSTSFYGEVLAGIQIRIVSHFSLGWNVRWHYNFHTTADGPNKPWFIPGCGTSTPVSVHVTASWTIPAPSRLQTE